MKLLTLTTFPFNEPRHGGQHRVFNIVKKYESLGHSVESVGILGSRIYENQKGFLAIPEQEDLAKQVDDTLFMEDVAIGRMFANSEPHFLSLASQIRSVPDAIHVEHPWLFEFACAYRKSVGKPDMKLIYGSANVEHKLKYSILKPHRSELEASSAAEEVLACELFAIKNADAICCVSQQDMEWTRQFTTAPCVVALNGVSKRDATAAGVQAASRISEHKKFALYCASGHPPNVTGFFDMFSAGLGCIAPDQLLVIAGSAGPSVMSHRLALRTPGLNSRLRAAGEVDEATLQGLLNAAHAIVLPITQGEGTNLKTAEALWAKKYIVATTKAMRGFETFKHAQGLHINDVPSDFLQSLQAVMSADPHEVALQELPSREEVLWERTLVPLTELLK